eukprot:3368658-Pleurochrysis_carterae.AAC.1
MPLLSWIRARLVTKGIHWKFFTTDRIIPLVTRLEDTSNVRSTRTISTKLASCCPCRAGERPSYGALHPMA